MTTVEKIEVRPPGPAPLARFLGWTFSGGVLTKGAVLMTTLIAARALTQAQFGQYVGLIATALLAAGLWDFGVSALLTVEFASGRIETRSALRRVLKMRLGTAVLWACAFVAGVLALDRAGDIPRGAIAGFAAASAFVAASMVALAMLRARLLFGRAAFSVAIGRWFTALISLGAIPSVGLLHGLGGFAFAMLVGEAVAFVAATLSFARAERTGTTRGDTPMSESEIGRALSVRRALPYTANGLLAMLYNRLDVLIVGAVAPMGQLALYAPASRIQDALYLVPSSIFSVALPVMSRAFNSAEGAAGLARLIRRFELTGLAASAPLSVAFFALAPQLLSRLLGPQYVGAATATRIVVCYLPVACVCAPLMAALAACGRAPDTTRIFAVAAVVAISLHLALDWHFGAVGGAIASLLRDPAALLAAYVLARRAGVYPRPASVLVSGRMAESSAVS